jgi:NAD(P)-dependent dehydrogenase (short-subunit alcohol dehydrogenase family)
VDRTLVVKNETGSGSVSVAQIFDLSGKVAVVTGGSRGIGRSIVMGLAAGGADVVIASRKLENCEEVAAQAEQTTGRKALAVRFDAGHWQDCDDLADTVYDVFGRCDVLVSNAGMSPLYPDLVSVTEALYDKTHAVNAKGPFRLGVLLGTRMAEANGGSIINVSASGSWRPQPTYVPYAMAKAALNALTLALAGAWSPKVRANTVLPGPFETDIAKAWPPGQLESIAAANPLGRAGVPADMVGVCVFLASDASRYINGAQILVDGGAMRTL